MVGTVEAKPHPRFSAGPSNPVVGTAGLELRRCHGRGIARRLGFGLLLDVELFRTHDVDGRRLGGFHLDRDEPGYWLGSYTVNLFATEGIWVVFFVIGMVVTWPDVPWSALLYGGLAVGILTPFLLFPHTKTLYLAIDLCFRPPEPTDLVVPMERGFALPHAKGGRTPPPAA